MDENTALVALFVTNIQLFILSLLCEESLDEYAAADCCYQEMSMPPAS